MTSNNMHRLGKFYAARAQSALKREQEAGYHWGYLTGEGKKFCTCGFVLNLQVTDDSQAVAIPPTGIEIEPIVQCRGHFKLPKGRDLATALIVSLRPINQGSQYITSAWCQECTSLILDVPLIEAQEFIAQHESTCGGNSK